MSRLRPLLFVCVALMPLCHVTATQAQTDVAFSVPAYVSPTFTNTEVSSYFVLDGLNTTVTLLPFLTGDFLLDASGFSSYDYSQTNSDPSTTFTGTVLTPITIDGVTKSVPFDYSVIISGPAASPPLFATGTPVVFDIAAGNVTVTPFSELGLRRALIVFTPVPEPGMVALFGGMVTLGGLALRRRTRK